MVDDNELKQERDQLEKEIKAIRSTLTTTRKARPNDIVSINALEKKIKDLGEAIKNVDNQLSTLRRKRRQQAEHLAAQAKKRRQERKGK